MRIVSRKTFLGCGAALAVLVLATGSHAQQRTFNVPSQEAVSAIPEFARQAGIQITAPASQLAGVRTPAVRGDLDTREALAQLLEGTGLEIASDRGSVIALRRTTNGPQDQGPANDATDVDTIVVTGSRIVRNGYSAPSPTTVLSVEDIQARAPINVADYINQLPQMGRPTSPRTTTFSATTTGGGANLLNTRGLGATRTLVLLDGRRVVSAGLNSAVDINLLPTNLLQRVDVVTGGASAAYGSDAVAGVVNFILDNHFTGVKGSVSFGTSEVGDAETTNADLAFGTDFAGGRGHVLLSGQYFDGNGVSSARSRDWYDPGWRLISNPNRTATNGEPGQLIRDDVGYSNVTPGGLILSGPLRGVMFGEGGAIQQFQFGNIVSGNLQAGGTIEDTAGHWPLLPDNSNWAVFGRASYDLTDSITAFAEYTLAGSEAENWSSPYARSGNITVSSDNAFLPLAIRQSMAANNLSTFTMGRINYDLVEPGGRSGAAGYYRDQQRYLVALEGRFLESGSWRTYYQRGESDVTYTRSNNPIVSRYNQAIDAVANPAAGGVSGVPVGNAICRSSLANPANGCLPLNIFGTGVMTQSAIDWVLGASEGLQARQNLDIQQDVFAIDAQYEPFSLWAGPVSVAAGFEYRKEQFTATADDLSLQSVWFTGNFAESQGSFEVKEVFAEVLAPLVKDAPFIKALDFNGAIRRTDYSTSGEVTTWKAGLTWDVNDELRLRGTRSQDIRAPNLNDLFAAGTSFENQFRDSSQPGSPLVSTWTVSGGNPNLLPEEAETWTGGLVYRPNWLAGFSAAIDYYKISISDAIVSIGAQQLIDQCYGVGVAQNPAACGSIVPANPNNLAGATIYTGGTNAQELAIEGVDFEFGYRTDLAAFGDSLPGSIDLRLLASNRLTDETDLAGTVTNGLGTPGSVKWQGLLSGTYSVGPSRTTVTLRYIGDGKFNNWPLDHPQGIPGNHFDAMTYVELAQNYDVQVAGKSFTVFGVVENLFDTDPERIPGGYSTFGTTTDYDLIGRTFRAGVRFRF
jgi:outer membrane receptor protein involved in Fe transport